jgi:hypothetical protein
MSSNGITSIPRFAEMGQMVRFDVEEPRNTHTHAHGKLKSHF